jgi:predicted GNAT family acetyltransferase
MTQAVIDNTHENRFELNVDGQIAHADYRVSGDTLYIDYVEAPPALRGTGAAGRLMEGVMTAAAEKGYAVVPICGYAAAWMRRHRKL